jgi:hypothetical protein
VRGDATNRLPAVVNGWALVHGDCLLVVLSAAMDRQTPSHAPRMTETIERFVDDAHRIVWLDNVEMIWSRTPPSRAVMRRIIVELEGLARAYPSGVGSLLVIRSDVAPPDEEARAYIREAFGQAPIVAAAQVVLGKGFVGAAMRSVLSLIQLLARPGYPMKVFGDPGSASQWLVNELEARAGHAPEAHALTLAATQGSARFLGTTPSGPGWDGR